MSLQIQILPVYHVFVPKPYARVERRCVEASESVFYERELFPKILPPPVIIYGKGYEVGL